MFIGSFTHRSNEPELMDDPDLDPKALHIALRDIERTNTWLGGNEITIKALRKVLKDFSTDQEISILDVGCGDGAMLRAIAKDPVLSKYSLRLVGLDLSRQSIKSAKEANAQYPNIQYEAVDVLQVSSEQYSCDMVLMTLTLHHFTDQEIPKVLQKCKEIASVAILINDLQRSKIAHGLFRLFSVFFIKGNVAKNDGLVSIRRGFLKKELYVYAKNLGLQVKVTWKWAFRYLMRIDITKKKREI